MYGLGLTYFAFFFANFFIFGSTRSGHFWNILINLRRLHTFNKVTGVELTVLFAKVSRKVSSAWSTPKSVMLRLKTTPASSCHADWVNSSAQTSKGRAERATEPIFDTFSRKIEILSKRQRKRNKSTFIFITSVAKTKSQQKLSVFAMFVHQGFGETGQRKEQC